MPGPTLAEITARGRKVAMDATEDLNSTVYERIGLAEPERSKLTDLLAQLRTSGNEFDVERSEEVIEDVTSRRAPAEPAGARVDQRSRSRPESPGGRRPFRIASSTKPMAQATVSIAWSRSISQSETSRSYVATLHMTSSRAADRCPLGVGPFGCLVLHRKQERASLAEVGVGERRIERRLGAHWVRGHMGKYPRRDVGDILESHALQLDSGLLLQPVHDGITKAPLVPEVAVDRPLVHPRRLGDAAHRERAPVSDG